MTFSKRVTGYELPLIVQILSWNPCSTEISPDLSISAVLIGKLFETNAQFHALSNGIFFRGSHSVKILVSS